MSNILILGATSAIAKKTTRLFAADEHSLYLVARNEDKLSSMKQDMLVRGAKEVHYESLDLADEGQHEDSLNIIFNESVNKFTQYAWFVRDPYANAFQYFFILCIFSDNRKPKKP